jgi:hypothetical protein
MTPLERRWVESEWRSVWGPGITTCAIRDLGGRLRFMRISRGVVGRYVAYDSFLCVGIERTSSVSSWTLAAAKSDAEAMYRQWVYDEYGVVLP